MPYTVANLAIAPANRQVLHERIKQRFTHMLEQGFIDEVVALRKRSDLHSGLPSIRAVGYRQVWDYLDGKLTSAEMQERGIIATRQLAKRQFTWLRSWDDLHWLDSLDCDNLPRALKYLGTDLHIELSPCNCRLSLGVWRPKPSELPIFIIESLKECGTCQKGIRYKTLT